MQSDSRVGKNFCSGHVIAEDVAIMSPRLRESNIFQRSFSTGEKGSRAAVVTVTIAAAYHAPWLVTETVRRAAA